jgi:hypothetical protein
MNITGMPKKIAQNQGEGKRSLKKGNEIMKTGQEGKACINTAAL